MRSTVNSSAAVGGLMLLCLASVATAQTSVVPPRPVTHLASVPAGAILGSVLDERGAPVVGAMVSALGATSAFAVSDRSGRFELRTLPPGPYLVRAHLVGFVASRGQVVEVRPSGRASSSIALRHANPVRAASPLLAGVGGEEGEAADGVADDPAVVSPTDDHSELAWRLRHIRRGILKDAEVDLLATGGDDPDLFGPATMLSRAVGTPGRLATAFIAGTPFSGQVNLLTTGMSTARSNSLPPTIFPAASPTSP